MLGDSQRHGRETAITVVHLVRDRVAYEFGTF